MQEMQTSEVADQFVKGLDYPVSKSSIVAAAREADLSSTIQEALKKLPEREYAKPDELTQALNAG
jgi:uncharacterized protein DUF2795